MEYQNVVEKRGTKQKTYVSVSLLTLLASQIWQLKEPTTRAQKQMTSQGVSL